MSALPAQDNDALIDLYEAINANPYCEGFTAPSHFLAQNCILDDVPNSLVPVADFGRQEH